MNLILLLAVFGGLAYRMTSPADRARYLGLAKRFVLRLKVAATEPGPEDQSFREALRARTRHAFVTPAVVAVNVMVVGGILFGAGAISNPDTLVAWGANLGTRTTNGEWWRLVTSTFVHTGTLHLLVDVAVLIQLGAVLERLVGRLAFTGAYLSAGAFAGLVNLSSHPVAVIAGSSGAIFGLYGLLLASLIWQTFRQALQSRREALASEAGESVPEARVSAESEVTIPLIAMKRLGVGAAVFVVYSAVNGFAYTAEFTGLAAGLIYGLVLGRRVSHEEPKPKYVGAAMVATAVIAVACAIPLRNITDVTPEINRLLATEERTAATYQAASDAFKRQRTTAEALAQLAEHTIVPELQASDARLKALANVPPEHQGLVADAREYLRLRCTSWRARAAAIRRTDADPRGAPAGAADTGWRLQAEARFRSNMAAMGKAESAERASLEVFQRIRRAALPSSQFR
jgi:membrane associated rhomboid family serine protease